MPDEDMLTGNDALRRAVDWLNEQEGYSLEAIQEASRRFTLTPEDQEYLVETFLPDTDV